MTPEQLEAVNDSDVLCSCGANPREAESLSGWFVETRLVELDLSIAVVRCPRCW